MNFLNISNLEVITNYIIYCSSVKDVHNAGEKIENDSDFQIYPQHWIEPIHPSNLEFRN